MKTIRLFLALATIVTAALGPCYAIDHSPRWIGSTVLKYGPNDTVNGLVDLDNFPAGSYDHCKWGVLLERQSNADTLGFSQLTAGPFANSTKDLFLARMGIYRERIPFPYDGKWNPANGSYQKGYVSSKSFINPDFATELFRYLHFAPILFTTETNGTESRLRASTKKLIVLIHGWNPDSDSDSYDTLQFHDLTSQLQAQIAGEDAGQIKGTDWKMLKYHWEADADTGSLALPRSVALEEATEAAEIAHQHGQHLGELIYETCPTLQSIQFIAHSAGSWAARSAAKFLMDRNPNLVVAVTLLDPFIPAAAGKDSHLTTEKMGEMKHFRGNDRLARLENYFANDFTGSGTQEQFNWRGQDLNLRVDWSSHYGDDLLPGDGRFLGVGHSGPIQFYSDTIASTIPGAVVSPDLEGANYYAANRDTLGWWQSLFWNEPIVLQQPKSLVINANDSAEFTIQVTTRRAHYANLNAEFSVQWHKDGQPLIGETSTTLTIPNVTAAAAGEYAAVVYNFAGRSLSIPAGLTLIGGIGMPTITKQPQNQTVVVGQTATFSVAATGNGALSYQWNRNGTEISGATADSYTTSNLSLSEDGDIYQVVVSDTQGFQRSRFTTVFVSAARDICDDFNEPNDSSLTSTPISFGSAVNGYVCSATDIDWFQFKLNKPGIVNLQVSIPALNDYDIELFGPSGSYIKGSYSGTGVDERITFDASITGTYWVRIYGYPVGSGSYSTASSFLLKASFQEQPADNVRFFDSPGSYSMLREILQEEFGSIESENLIETISPYYVIEGSDLVTLRFRYKNESGGAKFNFGLYRLDAVLGAIETSTREGKIEYANKALALGNAISIFDEGLDHPGAEKTMTVKGGDTFGFYILRNATLNEFQNSPHKFDLESSGTPLNSWPLLSFSSANLGNSDQMLAFFSPSLSAGLSTAAFAWEDTSRTLGSDSDFNDVVIAIDTFYDSPKPPSILVNPVGLVTDPGTFVTFDVRAVGAPSLKYQWQRNGVDIPNATGSNYSTGSLTIADDGAQFQVRITNSFGSVVSQSAKLNIAVTPSLQAITHPGDSIVPTSGNSPAPEGVGNAIDDNPETKYLNFDRVNTGFTVTPSLGKTVVSRIAFQSANDAPYRDPASYKLEGSNDGIHFSLISTGKLPTFSERFQIQSCTFINHIAYRIYRLTFPNVANPDAANSMQIAEVKLLGRVVSIGSVGVSLGFDMKGTGEFHVLSRGESDVTYHLEASTDLINWLPVFGLNSADGQFDFADPQSKILPQRFYRVVEE